jgi:glutamate decarboxylase
VLKRMREIIGFENGESIMAPGGTISNLYSVILSRFHKFPQVKMEGMRALPGKPVVFTSNQCHYSIKTACAVTGVGLENCIMVDTDWFGRMMPEDLERLIVEEKAKGNIPLMVNATAGTTVMGAFDPLEAIADICEKYDIWMHVDVRNYKGHFDR